VYQKDLISRREEGTGLLFLDSSPFRNWQHGAGRDSQTLYCLGPPGSGKTFITSLVVGHLQARYENIQNTGLAYIYFDVSQRNRQEVPDILKSLLRQLLQSLPSLSSEFLGSLRNSMEGMLGQKRRVDVLVDALGSLMANCSQTFIVFDGLDEYQHLGASEVLSKIWKLQARTGLKLFMASRAEYKELGRASRVYVQDWQDEDMKMYSANRIAGIHVSATSKSFKENVVADVITVANGR